MIFKVVKTWCVVFIVYIDVDYCVYKLEGRLAPLEACSRSAGQDIDVDYCVYKL